MGDPRPGPGRRPLLSAGGLGGLWGPTIPTAAAETAPAGPRCAGPAARRALGWLLSSSDGTNAPLLWASS